ncbi:aspartate carbamoyltransferase [Phytophthora cinnamomi]|uniref:aspartate carbamoyltransferase n=1 Tax=Phytophthora cinnamomi TaxID=4785 RepID=UPI00355A2776|nr:aspartate carbamoyltransferase [Phytophthora cinnamomi]
MNRSSKKKACPTGIGTKLPLVAELELVKWANGLRKEGVPISSLMLTLEAKTLRLHKDGKTAVGLWQGENNLSIAQFGRESAQRVLDVMKAMVKTQGASDLLKAAGQRVHGAVHAHEQLVSGGHEAPRRPRGVRQRRYWHRTPCCPTRAGQLDSFTLNPSSNFADVIAVTIRIQARAIRV